MAIWGYTPHFRIHVRRATSVAEVRQCKMARRWPGTRILVCKGIMETEQLKSYGNIFTKPSPSCKSLGTFPAIESTETSFILSWQWDHLGSGSVANTQSRNGSKWVTANPRTTYAKVGHWQVRSRLLTSFSFLFMFNHYTQHAVHFPSGFVWKLGTPKSASSSSLVNNSKFVWGYVVTPRDFQVHPMTSNQQPLGLQLVPGRPGHIHLLPPRNPFFSGNNWDETRQKMRFHIISQQQLEDWKMRCHTI